MIYLRPTLHQLFIVILNFFTPGKYYRASPHSENKIERLEYGVSDNPWEHVHIYHCRYFTTPMIVRRLLTEPVQSGLTAYSLLVIGTIQTVKATRKAEVH